MVDFAAMSDRSGRQEGFEMGLAVRWFGGATLAFVTLFHLEILIDRWRDASLGSPGVALRWLLSAALLAGILWLRRRHGSILRGRAGLVIPLAILLLHLGGPPLPADGPAASDLLFALPVGLAFGIAAITATMLRRVQRVTARRISGRRLEQPSLRRPAGRLDWRFLPRPPPLAAPLG